MLERYAKYLDELKKDPSPSNLHLNSRVLVVDGLNSYIRAFATSPVTNDDGIHVGGITGFLLTIGAAIKQIKPTRVILVFDGKGGSQRRRKSYPEYKNNRKPGSDIKRNPAVQTDEDVSTSMRRQMARLGEYLSILPLTTIIIDNIEADDTIGVLTTLVRESGGQTFIMSTDKDFLQLIDKDVVVWSPTKKKMYFEKELVEEYGIHKSNFLLYRTITGDKGDNLPKVKGIGIKTLIKHLPMLATENELSLDELFTLCKDNPDNNKVLNLITESEDLIRLNYKLMQLKDPDISGTAKIKICNLFDSKPISFNKQHLYEMLIDDRMTTAIKNVQMWCNEVFQPLDNYNRYMDDNGSNSRKSHLHSNAT